MIIPSIVEIPQICSQLGIDHAVISPGSRSAHLTIAFARHPGIRKLIIPDERSAAYIAMGIAQSSNKPVVLVCTSGTAAINYYPAITEAYYQNIPLLVLTADRPAKWIDKNDGQTIRQTNLYSNHIKCSFSFPESDQDATDTARNLIADAIKASRKLPRGPVHVNIPIDEPFYPEIWEEMHFKELTLANENSWLSSPKKDYFSDQDISFLAGKKVAIIAGQNCFDSELLNSLAMLSEKKKIPVFSDVISNANSKGTITHHDSFDPRFEKYHIPEVIISFGKSILSKRLKLALRRNEELVHWHISENDFPADTYLSLNRVFYNSPRLFFDQLLQSDFEVNRRYLNELFLLQSDAEDKLRLILDTMVFCEFKAFSLVWNAIPKDVCIHLANSMPVRYANILGNQSGHTVYANRGTSGIDGSNSTAVGHAFHNKGQHLLLSGDMSFFYDRNAFWHNSMPDNLKVVVFNNHGGGIFRLIDGPARQPELEDYFETHQKLTARNTAHDFGMDYYFCDSVEGLMNVLPDFIQKQNNSSILEIETINSINQKVFQHYKSIIKNEA